jgi:hypothetical protein
MFYNPIMLNKILNTPTLSLIRRNHGLEHATLQVLARRHPGLPMAGHSTASGFRLIGNLQTSEVEEAVLEALSRLRAGEHRLAIHPNCGTNFVTAGTLAGVAAGLSMLNTGPRRRDVVERLALAASLATVAMMVGLPLGLRLQEGVTVSGDPGNLEVVQITRQKLRMAWGSAGSEAIVHFVRTRG